MAERPEGSPTVTGVVLESVVPSPSWPYVLSPQQRTEPSSSAAQVWCSPEDSATASSWEGMSARIASQLSLTESLPSWPYALLPQQPTEPLCRIAQVCSPPDETSRAEFS